MPGILFFVHLATPGSETGLTPDLLVDFPASSTVRNKTPSLTQGAVRDVLVRAAETDSLGLLCCCGDHWGQGIRTPHSHP